MLIPNVIPAVAIVQDGSKSQKITNMKRAMGLTRVVIKRPKR